MNSAAPVSVVHDPRVQLAIELTQIPTAAGREHRVIAWLNTWLAARPHLQSQSDAEGNITITINQPRAKSGLKAAAKRTGAAMHPLYITGHLDHPAFVVERIVAPGVLELSFRGGVMDVFFEHAPITLHTRLGPVPATLTGTATSESPAGKHYTAELDDQADTQPCDVQLGDVATWRLPPAEVDGAGILHTHACDDLAAVAAALCAIDHLGRQAVTQPGTIGDVRVLLTRAEEIGFVGAIAACRLGTIAPGSRILALENSRAFAESPVGGGPIVRVGDRMTVFTPWLTEACATRAEEIFASPAQPLASQTASVIKRPWQRKLMAGGACEASVFCRSGYDATCLCLPLGNYHNMPHLTELQAGTYDRARLGPPRAEREFIHTQDYLGLIDLLVALGQSLPTPDSKAERFDTLYRTRRYVLDAAPGEAAAKPGAAKVPRKPKAKAKAKTKPAPKVTIPRRRAPSAGKPRS
jgi:endoglucanase